MSQIELLDVSVQVGATAVLAGVSLDVPAGSVVCVTGPSGSGKTTLIRVVLGFVAPTTGEVRLRGQTVSAHGRVVIPPEERNLAVVFQDLALWPHLTVRDNLAFGLAARGMARTERNDRIEVMLRRVGLSAKASAYPAFLSGGERQRVALARALVLEPRAVLLDEPLTSLDVALRREISALLDELLHEFGTTAIYVTHDPRELLVADAVCVLEGGTVTQTGTVAQLVASPATPFVATVVDGMSLPIGA